MAMTGDEIRDFYARCAAARQRFQDMAVQSLPKQKVLEQMERLGLALDPEMGQVSDAELAYAFDLAIHTSAPGRSRAIDRVVRRHASLPGEAALVLNALGRAWLSIFRVLDRHPEEGLILKDELLGGEVWLVDQSIAETAPPGTVIASRIGRVLGFCISTGVVAELDENRLAGINAIISRSGVAAETLLEDPRFATMMWQDGLGFRIG
ncbi:MAG: hypothetical protein AAGC69_03300 [Paracraurococcus sp.]|jgi:hypothetical protein